MRVFEIDNKTVAKEPATYVPRVGDVSLADLAGRIIRNPGYGGPKTGINGWVSTPAISACRKPQFMEALEESIRSEGYRNPIICYATPTGLYVAFGGSRVIAGRKAGKITIPAIINDYTGEFDHLPEVTIENFTDWFTDPPVWYVIDDLGADYHYSIERNRRDQYDSAGMNWVADDAAWLTDEFPWL